MTFSPTSFFSAIRRHPLSSCVALLLSAGALLFCQACAASSRKNYPTAVYRSSLTDGSFSIREYPALKVARTGGQGDDGDFMKLFRYIGGANEPGEKISMTTPVLMEGGAMNFVMPESHQKSAPPARDRKVEIATLPARKLAACSYSGRPDGKNREDALMKLRARLNSRHLAYRDEPIFAVYDGPFTLPWQRLNEVFLPLK